MNHNKRLNLSPYEGMLAETDMPNNLPDLK